MKIKKLHPDAIIPSYAHEWDAGLDLFANVHNYLDMGNKIYLHHNEIIKIPTGIAIEIPTGKAGIIKERSGLSSKGYHLLGGVIDCGYTGEIFVTIHNLNPEKESLVIQHGMCIAQMLLLSIYHPKIEVVEELEETERGSKGFGSTNNRAKKILGRDNTNVAEILSSIYECTRCGSTNNSIKDDTCPRCGTKF